MTSTSKTQVDQLGDRLRKGKLDEDHLRRLDAYRRSFAEGYEEVVATIRETTQLDPTGRPAKSTTSIIEKLRRETMRLSQMQDIAGCRLVVPDVLAQNQVVERLKAALPKAFVVDRREHPSYGYRAVHIIATARNKPIEIQVRTELQHLWAQLSEKLSDAFDPTIKYGGGEGVFQKLLLSFSDTINELEFEEQERDDVEAFLAQMSVDHPEYGKVSDMQRQLFKVGAHLASMKAQIRSNLAKFLQEAE